MSEGKRLSLVAAVARGGVIGVDNGLPWHLPEDLKHFRAVTTGHAIVMGRKTYDSIGRPLPNRRNIVVTRDPALRIEGCDVITSVDEALALAWSGDDAPCVIGGATLYAATLGHATDLHLTEVDREVAGDAFFPAFDRAAFDEIERRPGTTPGVEFVHLRRR